MTVREIEKLLSQDGWYTVTQVGSHKQFKHPSKPELQFQYIREI